MVRRLVLMAALALVATLPFAAAQSPSALMMATPATAVPASANTALTGQIMQRLTDDPVLGSLTITASVGANNAVSLNGVVANQQLADRAVAVVQTIPGVGPITNNMLVNVDPFAPQPPPPSATAPPLNAPVAQPLAAGEPQAQIADALGKVPALVRVSVQVYGNRVMLLGSVANKKDSERADEIARKILPRAELTNIIWVDPYPLAPPPLVPKDVYASGGR